MMWKTVSPECQPDAQTEAAFPQPAAVGHRRGTVPSSPCKWTMMAMGASLVLGLGIHAGFAASEDNTLSLNFVFVDDDGQKCKVDSQTAVPAEQLMATDVQKALEAGYKCDWSGLSDAEQARASEEALANVRNQLQEAAEPAHEHWHFSGLFGTFDRAALQRGYQVYREVCSSCHAMEFMRFRNLSEKGGPEMSEEAVKALAAEFTVEDGPDESGDMFERDGKPSDPFPKPFANENLARASNNGALPPDLSLITKARHHGPDYIHSLLTGYDHPVPPLMQMQDGLNYNPYFSGRQIAMPKQLFDGLVTYSDGTDATADQMAKDVVEFLTWAAEPKLEERKATAVPVMIYLLVLTVFLYLSYKRIWRDVDH